jgi:hypothetical protein
MSDMNDERLDAMLKSRRFQPASPDLAERIILKAQAIPQNQTISLWQWLRQLFAESHLPKPVYVLASALILGLVIGFSTASDTTSTDDISPINIQGFLYADEGPL